MDAGAAVHVQGDVAAVPKHNRVPPGQNALTMLSQFSRKSLRI